MRARAQAGGKAEPNPVAALAKELDRYIKKFRPLLKEFDKWANDFDPPQLHFGNDEGTLKSLRQDMRILHERYKAISQDSAYRPSITGPTLNAAWQEIGRVVVAFWEELYGEKINKEKYNRSIIIRHVTDLIDVLTKGRAKCNEILRDEDAALGRLRGSG